MRAIPSTAVFAPPPAAASGPARPRWRAAHAMVAAAVLVVAVLAVVGLWVASGTDVTAGRPNAGRSATVPGADLSERATRDDTDCAAHSYGKVSAFFAAHPCTSLHRALFTGTSSGTPVVIAVSTVSMATEHDAADLQRLADSDGTGNVSDLLREGVTVPGGPARLHNASYASQRRGPVLVIVEAGTASGAGRGLTPLARAALRLGG